LPREQKLLTLYSITWRAFRWKRACRCNEQ
jgi:hypothetical protein